jgi:TDG/mug DNA glycosylase family protein
MSRVSGFSPVVEQGARILILGSMPGRASLDKKQYYALPQNAFWRIMGDLFDAGLNSPYAMRLERITDNHIGLWDVLENCHRPGSLDSAIDMASARPNDFEQFFRCHSNIEHVFFNGKKAADIYRRLVLTSIGDTCTDMKYRTLPSTSPAHAAMAYAEKLKQWSAIVAIVRKAT